METIWLYLKVLIGIMLAYILILIPQPFMKWSDANYICSKTVRAIESAGIIDSEIQNFINTLKEDTGATDAVVTFEGNFINNKIQLNEKFYVTVSTKVDIKLVEGLFGKDVTITIPINRRLKGISDEYWKPGQI